MPIYPYRPLAVHSHDVSRGNPTVVDPTPSVCDGTHVIVVASAARKAAARRARTPSRESSATQGRDPSASQSRQVGQIVEDWPPDVLATAAHAAVGTAILAVVSVLMRRRVARDTQRWAVDLPQERPAGDRAAARQDGVPAEGSSHPPEPAGPNPVVGVECDPLPLAADLSNGETLTRSSPACRPAEASWSPKMVPAQHEHQRPASASRS